MASSAPYSKKSEFRKEREMSELRKAGQMPAETDEDGRAINPHIPNYIAKAPWYMNKGVPSLKHQRLEVVGNVPQYDNMNTWYNKTKSSDMATKYRKGACENCGSMTHKTKECIDRPRRRGAKVTGKNIQADEAINAVRLGYEGKHDRWNGYNPDSYKHVIETFNHIETERRKHKEKEREEKKQQRALERAQRKAEQKDTDETKKNDSSSSSDDDSSSEDEQPDDDDKAGGGVIFGEKKTAFAPNLRIREDTAKYLRNLDLNSARYDPKTRSMRDDPNPNANADESFYHGDAQLKNTGESVEFNNMQRFSWEVAEKVTDLNAIALPSQAEKLFKSMKDRKNLLLQSKSTKEAISKYGGEEYLATPSDNVALLAQSEVYVTFTHDGRAVPAKPKMLAKSKYEEDAFENGHYAIYGSYYKDGKWGYACCKSLDKQAKCTETIQSSNHSKKRPREEEETEQEPAQKKTKVE